MKLPAPWSYSSLSTFLQCPRRFYLTKVSKQVKDAGTEATLWGQSVHSALEHRIKDKTPLPAGMGRFEAVAQEVESWSDHWITEEQFGLTENLEPTGFFDPDVWCRGVLDLYTIHGKHAFVGDYKTGKQRPDSTQLKLFAAAIFHKYPQVDKVRTAFLWLNHDAKTTEDFSREDLRFIWNHFLPQLRRLEHAYAADVWPPNPSGLCGWCPVGLAHCEHWRPCMGWVRPCKN